jgi:wyosine [tRNA(Phe)-imidazoG37] synthetase (radical SAM superfamily)
MLKQHILEIIIISLWLQLYVSVDAATKESLKAVDRPLFSDFWERFLVDMQKYLQTYIMKL